MHPVLVLVLVLQSFEDEFEFIENNTRKKSAELGKELVHQ
jgi:hypothetical protein